MRVWRWLRGVPPPVTELLKDYKVHEPLHRWQPNAKCFCDSGKKFKKCHRDILPKTTGIKDAIESEVLLQAAKKEGLTW